MESVDLIDSKSIVRNHVWVQIPPTAPVICIITSKCRGGEIMSTSELRAKKNYYLKIATCFGVVMLLLALMSNSVCLTYSASGDTNINSLVGMMSYITLAIGMMICFWHNAMRSVKYRTALVKAEYEELRK